MTTHTATVTTAHGNTAIADIASHAADQLAGIGPVEGMLPSADLIAAKLSGREFGSWDELNDAIADLVANDPGVFVSHDSGWRLRDSDSGEDLGPATSQQARESARTVEGHILVDADGHVVEPGSWAAQQPGIRRVWVSMAAEPAEDNEAWLDAMEAQAQR